MTLTPEEQNQPAPARVRMDWGTRKGDSTQTSELPFVIGVLGEFCTAEARRNRWEDRQFQPVDLSTFDDVLDVLQPRLRLELHKPLLGDHLTVDLAFHRLEDFRPERIVEQVDVLRTLQSSDADANQNALGDALDSILHAPEFQRLESAWRGLWHLVSRVGQAEPVRVRLIDVSEEELLEDLKNAPEIERTFLYKKLCGDPYKATGLDPFSLFLGDFTFTQAPDDMRLLSGIAAVASRCLAPFLAAAGPEMLNIKDFSWISEARDIVRTRFDPGNCGRPAARIDVPDHLESPGWKNFRDSEDSRFVGLVLPRLLLREPYCLYTAGLNKFVYNETCDGGQWLLWGNSAFAVAKGIAVGFELNSWFDLPVWNSSLAKGLPRRALKLDFTDREVATSLEVKIAEQADKPLEHHGFIPLAVGIEGAALVCRVPSCHRPKVFDNPFASAEARMHSQLNYLLAASRFMHHLKQFGRDANEHSRARLEVILNRWIAQYVRTDDRGSESETAQRPLRAGLVHLHEIPGNPEKLRMVAFLLPKFGTLTELHVDLRLATKISLPTARDVTL